jgi:ABC-type transporter Mla MlaB component
MVSATLAKPVVVPAPARVAFDNAPEVLETLWRSLGTEAVELDLGPCVEFDSSLVGVMLELLRRAAARGQTLRFDNPGANLRKLAKLYGAEEILLGNRD